MAWTVDKVVPVPQFEAPDPAGPDASLPNTSATSAVRERSGRPRAGIYNLFWSTMGGGEAVGAGVARALVATHDVTLLGPEPIRTEEFRSRVGIDLSQCSWLQVSTDDEASRVSESFDVFVNCTFMSRAENRARIGLYYVNFPGRVVRRSRERVIRAAMALARLASRLPTKSTKARTVERLLAQRIEDTTWTPSYTHVVANSEYARTWVRRLWHRDSTVIHPPVTTTLAPGDKQCLIASVGRFFDSARGHSKKQWELLETFHDMTASSQGTSDWRLALVGGADAESREYVLRIRRVAKDLPVDVIVNAPRSRVDDVLAHASIYWHASGWGENESEHPERFEHFGISVVEAMASGAVPVVFAVGGPADIVRDGVDGFHWRTREELIAATRRLMQDPELLARLSASAQERSREYGLDVFDRRVRETIDGVLHSA
jgi:glycosyltransferase involved in cell wall biosynthesis